MSEENVETVRRVYDAFGEGDFARALEEGEPDFEWIPPEQDVQGPVQGGPSHPWPGVPRPEGSPQSRRAAGVAARYRLRREAAPGTAAANRPL